MTISPNPVNEKFTLTINASNNQTIRLVIIAVTGTKIRETSEIIKTGENSFSVPTGNLTQGIYFLKVISNDGSINETLKFVK